LVLLLLVIGGGVGYYLVQQRGVGDVRQQASTAITMPIIGYQRTTIRAAGGYSQYPLAFLNDSPMLSEASATLYVPLFLETGQLEMVTVNGLISVFTILMMMPLR